MSLTKLPLKSSSMPSRHGRRAGSSTARSWSAPACRRGPSSARPPACRCAGGSRRKVARSEGRTNGRTLSWPDGLPEGAWRLQLTDAAGESEEAPLIVAPPRAFTGDFDRNWVIAVQLYGVRSARNWGMGDFTDLEGLIRLASELGADGIGLNPLHALFDDRPGDCSPYSPNSRLFLNALYIDAENIPGYQPTPEGDAIARLQQNPTVDYPGVAALKWRALRSAFEKFSADPDAAAAATDFDAFRAERGALLSHFACFEVMRQKFRTPWWEWPKEWRQPDEAQCAELRAGPDSSAIEFVEFVQWVADRQLGACKKLADRLGMKVGLYLDVAVGVQADGFDAWNEQVAISRHLAVGAPPDPLNTLGPELGACRLQCHGPRDEVCSSRSARCCGPRCAMPARSGSTTCSA